MLAPLQIEEADENGVIKLSEIGNEVNCRIAPVPNPEQGDEADVNAKGERIAQVTLNPSGETRFQISKSDLLNFAGAGPTSFQYVVYKGGSGNADLSEAKDFVIQH